MALKILAGPRLSERTTLRLGGPAQGEIVIDAPEDALTLEDKVFGLASKALYLGWGSNLLAMDHELDLAVVSLAPGGEPVVVSEGADYVVVRAKAGQMLPRLINWAAGQGFSGLENLAGIPGTVGGAVAMNAGSYGTQTAEVLKSVLVWAKGSGVFTAGPDRWVAGYRSFGLAGVDQPFLVLEACFRLAKASPDKVRSAVGDVLARKKATQPVGAATCGSAFKNPPGASAGMLLDQLGFKGKTLGGMAFSPMHANFLVNTGNGSAAAALELLDMARQAVAARFGITLELEVKVAK